MKTTEKEISPVQDRPRGKGKISRVSRKLKIFQNNGILIMNALMMNKKTENRQQNEDDKRTQRRTQNVYMM